MCIYILLCYCVGVFECDVRVCVLFVFGVSQVCVCLLVVDS